MNQVVTSSTLRNPLNTSCDVPPSNHVNMSLASAFKVLALLTGVAAGAMGCNSFSMVCASEGSVEYELKKWSVDSTRVLLEARLIWSPCAEPRKSQTVWFQIDRTTGESTRHNGSPGSLQDIPASGEINVPATSAAPALSLQRTIEESVDCDVIVVGTIGDAFPDVCGDGGYGSMDGGDASDDFFITVNVSRDPGSNSHQCLPRCSVAEQPKG